MATKNIVPRGNGEGSLGTEQKKWDKVYTGDVVLGDGKSLNTELNHRLDISIYQTDLQGLKFGTAVVGGVTVLSVTVP